MVRKCQKCKLSVGIFFLILKKSPSGGGVLLSVVLARVDGGRGQKADGEPSSTFSFLYIVLGTHQCHA